MAITSETIRNDYIGNGVLDTFPFEFIIYDQEEITVYVDGALQTVDIDFTIDVLDIEDPDGGNIVFEVASIPANLSKIAIISSKPYTQETVLALRDQTYEDTYDKAVILIKQLREIVGRGLSLSESSIYSDLTLPDPRAGYYLVWNDAETGFDNISHPSDRFNLPDTYVDLDTDGFITVAAGPAHYIVDTYLDAASDNLVKILGLSPGDVFSISALHAARTVVVKAGDFLKLAGGMDCTLNSVDYEIFLRMGAGNVAKELTRSANA